MKYSFQNDYSESVHPDILDGLSSLGTTQYEGYALDSHSKLASELIKKEIQNDNASIYFISGGTQTNLIMLSAMLRPYQSVIAVDTSHIHVHEAGAIEATGHKINAVKNCNGKITVPEIQRILDENNFEHTVEPKVVFLSQSTELGSIYTKDELTQISKFAHEHNLYVYLDGARLGVALMSKGNDIKLSDYPDLVDAFYIGGTKNGAFLGEALIIINSKLDENIRYVMKQRGALLAKSWIISIQFEELFKSGLYYKLASYANEKAYKLITELTGLGFKFLSEPTTNQIFPIMPNNLIEYLQKDYGFYIWQKIDELNSAIRLVTSWATNDEMINEFISDIKRFNEQG